MHLWLYFFPLFFLSGRSTALPIAGSVVVFVCVLWHQVHTIFSMSTRAHPQIFSHSHTYAPYMHKYEHINLHSSVCVCVSMEKCERRVVCLGVGIVV